MRVEGKVDTIFCYALLRIQHPIKVMYLKYYIFKTQMNLVLLLTFADWADRAVLIFFFSYYHWTKNTKLEFLYIKVRKLSILLFNPIPTGLGHVTLIYGLIPPMAGRNRVKHTFGGQNRLIKPINCRCRTICQNL